MLTADSTHGVLGKLFCDLSQATISTPTKAKTAASTLTRRLKSATVLQAQATLYEPSQPQRRISGVHAGKRNAAAAECEVLHLILAPLHLDLLGLIVDLNKIALDTEAIPGTTIGDLFCSLVGVGGAAPTL